LVEDWKEAVVKKIVMLLILGPAVLSAAGSQNTQAEPSRGMQGMSMMMNCPMKLEGTSVAVADTTTGVSLSFTTRPENVAELRRNLEQMATMHGTNADRPGVAMMQGQTMPGAIKYEIIESGARLTLTPNDPGKLAELSKQVRAHVEMMQKGDCSMMQNMMQGMMRQGMGTQPLR
jgi:hypothetical protein